MTPKPILDARSALQRAYEHLEALESEVAKHKRLDHYRVKIEPHGDGPFRIVTGEAVEGNFFIESLTDEVSPSVSVGDDLPRRSKAIFGDILTNVRSALDYLAYGLSVPPSNVGPKDRVSWKKKVAFPIFTKDPFLHPDNEWITRLRGISKPGSD